MVVYTLEQRWEAGLRSFYRRCRFWQKKIIFPGEVHFDLGGYVTSKIVELVFGADFGPKSYLIDPVLSFMYKRCTFN